MTPYLEVCAAVVLTVFAFVAIGTFGAVARDIWRSR